MAVRIKICGLTGVADATAAIEAGADLLGFILAPESPRYVTPSQVRGILAEVQPWKAGIRTVGVFVNQAPRDVAGLLVFCGLDLAQLHGEEPPEYLGDTAGGSALLRGRAYKGLRPRSAEEAADLARRFALPARVRREGDLPALLLDTYQPTRRGGTGAVSDWAIGARLAADFPILLAGGLNAGNVADAIVAVKPWGVDVSSGIEAEPGRKDHAAMRAFAAAASATIV
jgi:phosphoribosylanthranilate isomerase